LNDLSAISSALGDYKRALEGHERALAIRREVLGERHPDTVLSVLRLTTAISPLDPLRVFRLLDEFLHKLPEEHRYYSQLKHRRQQLLAKPIRPGFRQPSSKNQGQKGKSRKKHK
jgi:hypothetical protein